MNRRTMLQLSAVSPFLATARAIAGSMTGGENTGTGPRAIRYRDKVAAMLTAIRERESQNILEAAHTVARAVKNGNTCWLNWDTGHTTRFDLIPGRPGLPALFTEGMDEEKVRPGDCYLVNRGQVTQKMKERGVTVIAAPAPWGSDAALSHLIVTDSAKVRNRPLADIWIETGITVYGAIMDIPGSPAPAGPVSGIIGMTLLWMIAADACRILARDGISVPVNSGGAPALTADTSREDLAAPLMDNWFRRLMYEFEMAGAETGAVTDASEAAVDSVLNGGRVYCYSRYQDALAAEGTTRRGGLALTTGVHEGRDGGLVSYHITGGPGGTWVHREVPFSATPADTVLMGIFTPDDPFDLASLDTFRSFGATVVSIGPVTRGGRIPSGRTVPKEADIHLGMMCDTLGLFALPGFEHRVCPTSGAMMMQLFWMVNMGIIDGIMAQTGDVPGIFLSGAIEGGMKHLNHMHAQFSERGY